MRKTTTVLVILCIISTSFAVLLGSALYYLVDYHKDAIENLENYWEDAIETLNNYWIDVVENLENYWESAYENLAKRPYIENENVTMSFHTSDGTFHQWTATLKTLESQIYSSWYKKETGDFQYINLRDNETGEIHHVVDFRPFVIENNFATVIPNLYKDLGNNDQALVYEVWYVVTQLTTYRSEITETPKFPLQTLITGGGDCEDMAILIASMLKAAPENYAVKLVYMDSDNPTDPENVNHVVVWVETPSRYKTFVDGTSHAEMCPFTEVVGWYFEV